MKWIVLLLAIGLTATEKLDRTYLPPPGAQFAGGNPGDIQVPFEPPNQYTGPSQTGFLEPGRIQSPSPVTTTSYAFTQTTTYPPIEGYETTIVPINPTTGLPIQAYQYNQNLPGYNQVQGSLNQNTNVQPQYAPQDYAPDGRLPGFNQPNIQPLYQYSNQNNVTPGNSVILPGSVSQGSDFNQGLQYSVGQTNNQVSSQYDQDQIGSPGGTIQSPGSRFIAPGVQEGSVQYPGEQSRNVEQGFIPSPTSPVILPESRNNPINYETPSELANEGTYNGQQINKPNARQPQFTQKYQNVGQNFVGTEQPSIENLNLPVYGGPTGGNINQPGQNIDGAFNNIPVPGFPSSASAHSSIGSEPRPERPQAAADRNAVIINNENVRTPNGYSFSYDTSNGIHADESGIVDDGTKAQGSYSYIGDDGKVYSVIYTADENGFQPRGDHLPTAPPIPEAIQKIIEQAARDKEAGIVDDGSYDETKYGDISYRNHGRHRPQHTLTQNIRKPVVELINDDYDENIPQNEFNNNINSGKNIKRPIGIPPQRRPSSDKIYYDQDSNGKLSADDSAETERFENDAPLTGSDTRFKPFSKDNVVTALKPVTASPTSRINYIDEQNEMDSKHRGSSERQSVSNGGLEDYQNNQSSYPVSQVKDVKNFGRYPSNEEIYGSEIYNGKSQTSKDSIAPYEAGHASAISNDRFELTPNRNLSERPHTQGNRQPELSINKYDKESEPPTDIVFSQGDNADTKSSIPSMTTYGKNKGNNQTPSIDNVQAIDESGYYYNLPQQKPSQTQFPTRFKGQQVSSTMKPGQYDTFAKVTTVKPFTTPAVYNQRKESNRQSAIRRPFMTSRVTTTTKKPYNDYEDEGDYIDTNINDKEVGSTTRPDGNVRLGTQRPYQQTKTSSRPQKLSPSPIAPTTEKGNNAPGYKVDYSETVTPGYTRVSTTPSQNSRFGSTETPRRSKPQRQRRPGSQSNKPPSPQSLNELNNRDEATGPVSKSPVNKNSPGGVKLSYGSRLPPGQIEFTPQNYQTSTYRPSPTAAEPTNTRYQPSSSINLGTNPNSETYQPQLSDSYQNGYHYGPVRPEYSTTDNEKPTFVPETSSSIPGYYKNNYEQGPIGYSSTTMRPSSPQRPGTFILSGPESTTSQFSPSKIYQTSYQYGPSTSDNPTSITPTTPTTIIGSSFPTGAYTQTQPGHEYGPSGQIYSTTPSPSTVGTTPGAYTVSTTPNQLFQEYPTTQRTGITAYSTTNAPYDQKPVVDGFGRPILTDQKPGYSYPSLDASQYPQTRYTEGQVLQSPDGVATVPSSIPSRSSSGDSISQTYQQSPSYPGYYDQPKVIGEDFRGPKQPPRFDPQTGYHY